MSYNLFHVYSLCVYFSLHDPFWQVILKGEVLPYHWPPNGLDQSVLQIKTKIVSCHTADSKLVKKEVSGTVILPALVFLAFGKMLVVVL
jgi:hypothetical protein